MTVYILSQSGRNRVTTSRFVIVLLSLLGFRFTSGITSTTFTIKHYLLRGHVESFMICSTNWRPCYYQSTALIIILVEKTLGYIARSPLCEGCFYEWMRFTEFYIAESARTKKRQELLCLFCAKPSSTVSPPGHADSLEVREQVRTVSTLIA